MTVVIPSIPTRTDFLERAVQSVRAQTHQPAAIEIEIDHHRTGAAATRQRALDRVTTEYVAFLDDDDAFLPEHLEKCLQALAASGADLVYPWFVPTGCETPLGPHPLPFDPAALRRGNYIPVTVLVRTDAVRRAGGFAPEIPDAVPHEDWGLWLRMLDQGARFTHLPDVTWVWNHHGANTGGRPEGW